MPRQPPIARPDDVPGRAPPSAGSRPARSRGARRAPRRRVGCRRCGGLSVGGRSPSGPAGRRRRVTRRPGWPASSAGSGRAAASACRRARRRSSGTGPRPAAAASGSAAAAPPITPRRNQRGPSTPTKRARRLPAAPSAPAATGTSASSSGPSGPSRSSTRPPCWRICSRICSRVSSHSPRRAGRGERLHLQRGVGVVEADGDDALGLLLDLEAQVQSLARQDLDAAEVDVGADGVRLGLVERARRSARSRRADFGRRRVSSSGVCVGHAVRSSCV